VAEYFQPDTDLAARRVEIRQEMHNLTSDRISLLRILQLFNQSLLLEGLADHKPYLLFPIRVLKDF
jgi:hypothetical protein